MYMRVLGNVYVDIGKWVDISWYNQDNKVAQLIKKDYEWGKIHD